MDNPNCNTEHRKFQHLTPEERHEMIAKQLCRPFNTIKYEINRGLVLLYHGTVQRYSAKKAEQVYLEHRSHCRKQYKRLATSPFIQYVEEHFKDGWSLDACVGRAEIKADANSSEQTGFGRQYLGTARRSQNTTRIRALGNRHGQRSKERNRTRNPDPCGTKIPLFHLAKNHERNGCVCSGRNAPDTHAFW